MGVAGPASQGKMLKIGGAIFIIASLVLAANILRTLKTVPQNAAVQASGQVLGAFDQTTQIKTVNYTVERGDTLFNIAAAQGIDWSVIATMNNLKAPYALKPGMSLKLPSQN